MFSRLLHRERHTGRDPHMKQRRAGIIKSIKIDKDLIKMMEAKAKENGTGLDEIRGNIVHPVVTMQDAKFAHHVETQNVIRNGEF